MSVSIGNVVSWDSLKKFVRTAQQRAVQVRFRTKEGQDKREALGILIPVVDKETYLRWVSNSLALQDAVVDYMESLQDGVIRDSITKTGTFSGTLNGKNLFTLVGMEEALLSGESARLSKESLERYFIQEIAEGLTMKILEQCPTATESQIAKVLTNYQEALKKLASFSAKNKVSISEKEEADFYKLLDLVENKESGFYLKLVDRVKEMAAQRAEEANALGFNL